MAISNMEDKDVKYDSDDNGYDNSHPYFKIGPDSTTPRYVLGH